MATPRSYRQFCGLARALDHVGERWTLLMVRELLLGPRRYKDFLRALSGLTSNLLAKRLKELEADGIIEKVEIDSGRAQAYQLTEMGAALEPVITELGRWGGRVMGMPQDEDRFDPGWALISLKRRYKGGEDMRVQLRIDGREFVMSLEPEYLRIEERSTDAAQLELEGSFEDMRAWWYLGASAAQLKREGRLRVQGERGALTRFRKAIAGLG